jgi:hypothetical protein
MHIYSSSFAPSCLFLTLSDDISNNPTNRLLPIVSDWELAQECFSNLPSQQTEGSEWTLTTASKDVHSRLSLLRPHIVHGGLWGSCHVRTHPERIRGMCHVVSKDLTYPALTTDILPPGLQFLAPPLPGM